MENDMLLSFITRDRKMLHLSAMSEIINEEKFTQGRLNDQIDNILPDVKM